MQQPGWITRELYRKRQSQKVTFYMMPFTGRTQKDKTPVIGSGNMVARDSMWWEPHFATQSGSVRDFGEYYNYSKSCFDGECMTLY